QPVQSGLAPPPPVSGPRIHPAPSTLLPLAIGPVNEQDLQFCVLIETRRAPTSRVRREAVRPALGPILLCGPSVPASSRLAGSIRHGCPTASVRSRHSRQSSGLRSVGSPGSFGPT